MITNSSYNENNENNENKSPPKKINWNDKIEENAKYTRIRTHTNIQKGTNKNFTTQKLWKPINLEVLIK